MTPPPIAPTTNAVLVRLQATGLPVGDGRKPTNGGWQGNPGSSAFRTYLVLYPLDMRRDGPDASIGDRLTDPQLHYQITTVGLDRFAVETAVDLAADALFHHDTDFVIADRAVIAVTHESSAGVSRDEDVNPPLFFSVDRYRIDTGTP